VKKERERVSQLYYCGEKKKNKKKEMILLV